jgi:hypothetical protein
VLCCPANFHFASKADVRFLRSIGRDGPKAEWLDELWLLHRVSLP